MCHIRSTCVATVTTQKGIIMQAISDATTMVPAMQAKPYPFGTTMVPAMQAKPYPFGTTMVPAMQAKPYPPNEIWSR